jgi:hypothetical protein
MVGGTSHDTTYAREESLFSMPLQPGVKIFAHATGLALQSSAHASVWQYLAWPVLA